MFANLEQILQEVEKNQEDTTNTKLRKSNNLTPSPLLLKGQIIADELTRIENLAQGIHILLSKSDNQN